MPVDTLFAGSAVTPACGTGQLPVDRERLVASVLEVGAEAVAATCRAWPREAGASGVPERDRGTGRRQDGQGRRTDVGPVDDAPPFAA